MSGALDGLKVVDLSRILAGPWASQMLADMGAEVIKVERPKLGDDTRYWGPPFATEGTAEQAPHSAYYQCANRNKQSIAIDIAHPDGQQVLMALLKDADVLIENYKVGGLAKYHLDYQSVKKINPKLVYCSITGFGQTGPCAQKAGYDAMIQGEGGLMSLTGAPDEPPVRAGVALVDVMTGLYACNAILAALMARHRINVGQHIDIALLDVQVAALANQGLNYLVSGNNPERLGNSHPNIVPYQSFASGDGNLILAVGNDSQFAKFCGVIARPELATDVRYATNVARVNHRDELVALISDIIATHSTQHWLSTLEAVGVPCGPINTLDKVFEHPQVKHRELVRELADVSDKMVATVTSPINLSATPLVYHSAPPALGQHSVEILTKHLKMSAVEIDELFRRGIIG